MGVGLAYPRIVGIGGIHASAEAGRRVVLDRQSSHMIERTEPFGPHPSGPKNAPGGLADFASPLMPAALNIEQKSRSNLFPWRGQFSPQLVETLLRAYASRTSVVLDPFMGSGTVLVESARMGLESHGCEVNPAAFLLGRVYELCTLKETERNDLLDRTHAFLTKVRPGAFELPLFRDQAEMPPVTGSLGKWLSSIPDAHIRMLLEAMVVLVNGASASDASWANKWQSIRSIVTNLPWSNRLVHASLNDARSLQIPNDTIDFVLSSPPYINVFNYHHNSRGGVESLGWKPLVVARSEIGSNRKFRQNRFLTVIQYCIDMALALTELGRVCRERARIILVLGRESNVHKTAFFNGEILGRLASEVVGMPIHLKQERVFLNRFGQMIYEDILHMSPRTAPAVSAPEVVAHSRAVGREVLVAAENRVPPDRKGYLDEAIRQFEQVEASPILDPFAAIGDTR